MSRLSARTQRDYSPISWTDYFDEAHDIILNSSIREEEDSFRVYLKNFLHPYSPKRTFGQRLNPEQVELSQVELDSYSNVPTLVLLHGGGYSALTWAEFSKQIVVKCQCRILAIDLRGHGDTKTQSDDDLSIENLVSDVNTITHSVHKLCGFPETPKFVLIGHSMGGAIAIKCSRHCENSIPSLVGVVVIDVVEGTAKEALPQMLYVIKSRPSRFSTLSNAIEWSVRSGMAKNSHAARVSMPGNLLNISTGELSIHDVPLDARSDAKVNNVLIDIKRHKFGISIDQLLESNSSPTSPMPRLPLPPRIAALRNSSDPFKLLPETSTESRIIEEEDQDKDLKESREDVDGYKRPPDVVNTGYTWRTNLAKTKPYWNGWFDELSSSFLEAPVQGKFLLLAGIDRLDKTLTIAQMQGKFMMKVLPKCGHAVHEDVPEQVAEAIGDFLIRNKIATTSIC